MLTENSETLGVENCLQPISKNADIHLQKLKNTFFWSNSKRIYSQP